MCVVVEMASGMLKQPPHDAVPRMVRALRYNFYARPSDEQPREVVCERAGILSMSISIKRSFVYTRCVRGMTRSVRELLRCSNLLFLCPLKQTAP